MDRRQALIIASAFATFPSIARAQETQAPLTAAEQTLVQSATTILQRTVPNPTAAETLGWFRFSNEDSTGAISYVNPSYWDSPDLSHPAQLWYDVYGHLIGADFMQLVSSAPNGPTLFGVAKERFGKRPLHVHYGLYRPDGSIRFGIAVRAAEYQKVGDPLHPTPAGLVKMGKASSTDQVAFVFPYMNAWDLGMWLVPNPKGAFADDNPNIKPSPNGHGSGEDAG
jgi:hypothetical protein